jgi:hypothetical protein
VSKSVHDQDWDMTKHKHMNKENNKMHKKWYHEGQLKTFLVLFLLTEEVLSKGNAHFSPWIPDTKQPS